MIVAAAAMGLAPSEFWALSQPEIDLQLRGGRQRVAELYELGLYVAYHLAAWMRTKALPDWSKVREDFLATREVQATERQPDGWQAVQGFMSALRTTQAKDTKGKTTDGTRRSKRHRTR